MAVKSFIRGDFRSLIIDNDYPTKYKIYFNNRWNYIQDENSFVNRLNYDESYLYRFNLKVLDNGNWVNLALTDNYYNLNEKRNSIFYRTITKENFIFKDRAVNFTETDVRLGLNNLQGPFISNELKYANEDIEEVSNKLTKDKILYKLGVNWKYDGIDYINYDIENKNNFIKDDVTYLTKLDGRLNNALLDLQVVDFSSNYEFTKNNNVSTNFLKSCVKQNYLNFSNYKIIYNKTNTDFNYTKIEYNVNNYHLFNMENGKEQIIDFSNGNTLDKTSNINSNSICSLLKTN